MGATRRLASSQLLWHRNDALEWYWHLADGDAGSVADDIVRVCSSPRNEATPFDADLSRVTKEEIHRLRRFPPTLDALRDDAAASALAMNIQRLAESLRARTSTPSASSES